MYAIAIESFGKYGLRVPMGNAGLQKLHHRTRSGIMKETEIFRHNTYGRVFVVQDFTQEMCEMNNAKLVDYVTSHYIMQIQ